MPDEKNILSPQEKVQLSAERDRLGDYEIVRHPHGYHSILHVSSGEVMHSVSDPVLESLTLYYNQSGLPDVLKRDLSETFVIWDVGLGAGTNAMITILELEKVFAAGNVGKRVEIFSFENDLDSFRLVVENPAKFPHVRHPAPVSLLEQGHWSSEDGRIEWRLLEGDFPKMIESAPRPDCIYYDLYSLNTLPFAWTVGMFRKIYERCKQSVRLMTYSASTRVRSNMLAAGFFTGYGAPSGPKDDTTIAFGSREAAQGFKLLNPEWLERWKRSGHRFDAGLTEEEKEVIRIAVLGHDQFN